MTGGRVLPRLPVAPLQAWLQREGWTTRELAEVHNLHRSTLQRWWRQGWINRRAAEDLCDNQLGVHPSEIWDNADYYGTDWAAEERTA